MSDPVADAIKEEEGKIEEKPIEKVEDKPKATGNEDVLKILTDIKESLTKPGEPAPSKAEIRAALKDKTGFTDAQLDVVEMMNKAVANQSNKKTAELQAKVTWNEFEKEIGGIDPAVDKLMKEELAQYDAEAKGDKVLLKKVYYLALGIQADKIAKQKKSDPNANDKPNDAENIVGRKIVETNKGSVSGLENDGKPKGSPGAQLSDDEKTVSAKMGISQEEYARAKSTKIVSQLKGKAA